MRHLIDEIAQEFVSTTVGLMTAPSLRSNAPSRATVMFSYGPSGFMDERTLARATAELDMDMIHLQFEPGRETDGPVNIMLCEDRNGMILTWPRCDLWAGAGSVLLLAPKDQDFGFAFNGAALVRVTDLPTGLERKLGVVQARGRLMSAVSEVSTGISRGATEAEEPTYPSAASSSVH